MIKTGAIFNWMLLWKMIKECPENLRDMFKKEKETCTIIPGDMFMSVVQGDPIKIRDMFKNGHISEGGSQMTQEIMNQMEYGRNQEVLTNVIFKDFIDAYEKACKKNNIDLNKDHQDLSKMNYDEIMAFLTGGSDEYGGEK